VDETLALLWNCSATGTIIMIITMLLLWQRSLLLRLPKKI
jgi:hypothetical protein